MDTQQTPPNPSAPQPTPGKNTGMAIFSYLGVLWVIPFLTGAHQDSYVKFHLKQGLVLIIAWILSGILSMVPFGFILWIVVLVLMVVGIINAASGKEKELPVIGTFAKHFNF